MCNWIQSKPYMTLAVIGDQKKKSDQELVKVSWELEQRCWKVDGNFVFCHTHRHFPATGNKNYHVRTQLIWKAIKNGQGYRGKRRSWKRWILKTSNNKTNVEKLTQMGGLWLWVHDHLPVLKTTEKCNRNHDSRFTVNPKLKKKVAHVSYREKQKNH